MPDPRELQQLIRDQRFQALSAPDQHATLRGFLAESDEEFKGFSGLEQQQLTGSLLAHYQPTLATTVADVAEYVPVVGGAVRGARAAEAGEPARPLTSLLSGGFEATSVPGRALQEAGRDVAELAALGGATALARPFLGRVAARVAGGLGEEVAPGLLARLSGRTGASELVDTALRATTSAAAERVAGAAAKAALRQRFVERGLTELTAGELFGITSAIERGISTGEVEPLEDFVKTPLGVAALGTAFYGLGGLARKLGIRNIQPLVDDLAKRDPERLARFQGEAAGVIDAVARTSGGRLSREASADVVFNAVREPLAAQADVKILRETLRAHPEVLDSELGLHLLRTQRERLTAPEVRVTASPGLRVTYDDEAGRTVTELLTDHVAQRAFAKRVRAGRIVVDNAAGDEAAVLRAGIRPGEAVEGRFAPGGGPRRLVPEGEAVVAGAPGRFFEANLPAVRPESIALRDELAGAAAELRAVPLRGVPVEPTARSLSDLAASPEAINRLRGEAARGVQFIKVNARSGAQTSLPATVDRIDMQPGRNEVIVRVENGVPRIDRAHPDVPAGLQNLALQRVARAAPQPRIEANPNVEFGTLPNGDVVMISKPGTTRAAAPPPGTAARSARGTPVRVLSEPDAVGRVLVETEGGRRVRANVRAGIIDAHESLFDGLPARTAPAVTLTRAVEPEVQRLGIERLRAQVRPGQIIHQTVGDVERRGVRPSVEVLAVDGDQVLVRSGDQTMQVGLDDIRATVENGVGKFAFDMTAKGADMLEAQAAAFNTRLREGPPIGDPKQAPQALARDVQLADELFSFDQRSGQRAGPSTIAQPANVADGLATKTKARQNRPAEERTKGGNALVRGCKR